MGIEAVQGELLDLTCRMTREIVSNAAIKAASVTFRGLNVNLDLGFLDYIKDN